MYVKVNGSALKAAQFEMSTAAYKVKLSSTVTF